MTKKIPSLGTQEMEMLKYVSENGPATVREVASYFEREKSLARTTVLTVMERLRTKGLLARAKVDGVFKYTSKVMTDDVLSSKVTDFVERTLGGSVSPLLAYFSSGNLSQDEIKQLKQLAAALEEKKEK